MAENVPDVLVCDYCGKGPKKMTIWWHEKTGKLLFLCFKPCQFFPEPFKKAGLPFGEWVRIDQWQPKIRRALEATKGQKPLD